MKRTELKVGYVVQFSDKTFGMVLESKYGEMSISGEYHWFSIKTLPNDLNDNDRDIVKVYGLSSNRDAHQLGTSDRELLWEKKERKEYTISQLEKILGYEIKIVKE